VIVFWNMGGLHRVAIVLAERCEFPQHIELKTGHEIFMTGVGKINAALMMADIIHTFSPDIVMNFGTAGSSKLNRNEVYQCDKFVQRDMDVTALGYEKYITPGDSVNDAVFEYRYIDTSLTKAICGSGDSFVSDPDNAPWDLADMEAYALAKVCCHYRKPFLCFKAISDGANSDSPAEYRDALKTIPERLYEVYKLICDLIYRDT